MNCTILEQEGLSNLVEAATALATFCLCSRAPAQTISPDQTKTTFDGPSTTIVSPQSTPSQVHQVIDETLVLDTRIFLSAEANKETFPQRLLAILNDEGVSSDVISWLPNGRSFIIARPDIFMESILPMYIAHDSNRVTLASSTTTSTKYPSFTRKLNRWGFRQVTRGAETGAFHHDLFRRDQPELCLQMFCQRSRSSVSAKKAPKECKSRQSTTSSMSQLKKSHVSLLTKESLEVMNQEQTMSTGFVTNVQTVAHKLNTVSEDSQSMRSTRSVSGGKSPSIETSSPAFPHNSVSGLLLNSSITNNPALVQRAITKRNEEERMRLAKVMLYSSFLQAMNGDDSE